MSSGDHAPLSIACVRSLMDKTYEKRKQAALEIEKMIKEFHCSNNSAQIRKLIKVLEDFASTPNPHSKKGALIGLAAVAVALNNDSSMYIEKLIDPILSCFKDPDQKVRYYACESLYNVVKSARCAILPQFNKIFSSMSKLVTDPDSQVKSASELLDRLLKDIVTEGMPFDMISFMPLIREHMYGTSSHEHAFIISWISVLDAVPDIDLVLYLPEILDGLFVMLQDHKPEIRKMCETVLDQFLRSIKKNPSRVNFTQFTNIVIVQAEGSMNGPMQQQQLITQFIAITWIKEFIQLSGPCMLPFLSGIIGVILPCLAYESDSRRNIKETATALNLSLLKLVAIEAGDNTSKESSSENELNLSSVIEVLLNNLGNESVQTKVAVLEWIHHLYTQIPSKMVTHTSLLIFPALLKVLSDKSDEVVVQCLLVLAEGVAKKHTKQSSPEGSKSKQDVLHYADFLKSLLGLFRSDKQLLDERGSFIIRHLCVLLNAEDIYRALANILLNETNLKFTSTMVETLNMLLLTASELFTLRNCLKDLNSPDSISLFICLYKCWAHSPVSTIALCLLSQNYQHVSDLVKLFGSLELTVDLLTEMDKLIQLIESPIFAFLRLELLSSSRGAPLLSALYGILMLLPQTKTFHTLKARLDCVPALNVCCQSSGKSRSPEISQNPNVDFKSLLEHFNKVQANQTAYKAQQRAHILSTLQRDMTLVQNGI